FDHGSEQNVSTPVAQLHMTPAARSRRVESEPALRLVGHRQRRIGRRETVCADLAGVLPQHGRDRLATLDGNDVPGEGDEVSPVALLAEYLTPIRTGRGGKRRPESRHPIRNELWRHVTASGIG